MDEVLSGTETTRWYVNKIASRGLFDVACAYVGNKAQWPGQSLISGDAFGPDGTISWREDIADMGLVTLQIRHSAKETIPFRAVLFGDIVSTSSVVSVHGGQPKGEMQP